MAEPISITIPHQLGRDEARSRIANGFDRLKGQMVGANLAQFSQTWDANRKSFSARTLGQTVSGRVDIGERDIRIELDLPAILAGMVDKISSKVQREGRLLLERRWRHRSTAPAIFLLPCGAGRWARR